MVAFLCMCLTIATTFAGELLNSFLFHNDINCITSNGQMFIYVEVNYMCHVIIIHSRKTILGSAESFLIYTYGFAQRHMI